MSKDAIIEMSPENFRKTITEMVRLEIARRLLEAEEGPEGSSEPSGDDKSAAITKAKEEFLDLLRKRTAVGRAADISKPFLDFVRKRAQEKNAQTLIGVSSLEDLADRLATSYAVTQKWDRAKKYIEELITAYIAGKGEEKAAAKAEKSAVQKNVEFKGKAEEILELIDTKLTAMIPRVTPGAKRSEKKQENIAAFGRWLKKNYPQVVDQSDDSVSALTKYADYFSQDTIPTNKSVHADLGAFAASSRTAAGIEKIETEIGSEEKADKEQLGADGKKYATVTDVDGAKLKEIGKELGVTEKAVNDLLKVLPPGKVNAIYNVLKNMMVKGGSDEAKRTLESYDVITKRAVEMAAKEFLMIMDDINAEAVKKGEELNLADLILALEDAKLREGASEAELAIEDRFLSRLVEIALEQSNWKALVAEMLKADLFNRKGNLSKSFQNLVSKAVGLIDPASWKKSGAGAPSKADKERMEKVAAFAAQLGRTGRVRQGEEEEGQ